MRISCPGSARILQHRRGETIVRSYFDYAIREELAPHMLTLSPERDENYRGGLRIVTPGLCG